MNLKQALKITLLIVILAGKRDEECWGKQKYL